MEVPVEVSARHVHLSEEDFEILFGKRQLKIKKYLSQPGQFLYDEKVTIEKDGKSLKASVLGPNRKETQVELSITDCRKLKLDVQVRESGDLKGSPGCRIIGTNGELSLKYGVIVAKRHIHVNSNDDIAKIFRDGEECCMAIKTKERSLIFCQNIIRISDNFKLAAHIDTDEANAAGIVDGFFADVFKA